jgi:hypothetical protein
MNPTEDINAMAARIAERMTDRQRALWNAHGTDVREAFVAERLTRGTHPEIRADIRRALERELAGA